MDELRMAHVCEVQPLDSKQIIADVDVILYQFCVGKWYAAVIKVEGISGKGLNKLGSYRKLR